MSQTYKLPCLQRNDDDSKYKDSVMLNAETAILPEGFDSLFCVYVHREDKSLEPLSPYIFQSLYFMSPILHPEFLQPFRAYDCTDAGCLTRQVRFSAENIFSSSRPTNELGSLLHIWNRVRLHSNCVDLL